MINIDHAAQTANVLANGAQNAGQLEQQRQQAAAEGRPAPQTSPFDVLSHTGQGLAQRDLGGAIMNGTPAGAMVGLFHTMTQPAHASAPSAIPAAMAQGWDAVKQSAAQVGQAQGALATFGAVMGTLQSFEQMLSMALSAIPFPAFPAVRIMDMDIGLPHAHAHPPNLIPPAPPVPLPSTGPIIPIPFLSGGMKTLINGMPAARCGDMGLGIWCGGYFPMYEVFLGSSNVWIEGNRAARLAVDITKHCIFTSPKPSDPPIGPMIGFTVTSSSNVLIGGIPMPSLLSMAMGAAFKALFKGVGRVLGAARRRLGRAANHMDECVEGAPILPVTGEMVDEYVDFELPAAIPFTWRRYYYSSWSGTGGPFGYGFRHEWQRELRHDGRAWLYVDPELQQVEFDCRDPGAAGVAHDGLLLRRTGENVLEILEPGQPTMIFHWTPGANAAPLHALRRGRQETRFRYREDGKLVVVDVSGETLRILYGKDGHISEIVRDADSQRHTMASYGYNEAGCLVSSTDPLGHSERYEYDEQRLMTVYVTRRNYSFFHEYDAHRRCVREWGEDGLYDVRMEYVPEQFKTIVRYADGATKVYRYDRSGTITELEHPEGGTTHWVLDDQGHVTHEIDPAGNVTKWLYNHLGGNTGRRDSLGYVHPPINVEPNPRNPLARDLPETPLAWEFGDLFSVASGTPPAPTDPILRDLPAAIANAVSNAFESVGNTGPLREHRDLLGRALERREADGSRQIWRYDPMGQRVQYSDRDGSTYRWSYSSWRNVNQAIDPMGATTSYAYNLREYPITVTDPAGTVSEYLYDRKDRIVAVRRHGRIKERYTYDNADNVVAKTDEAGRMLVTWDVGEGRLDMARRLASGETHSFEYDERGRFRSATCTGHRVDCAHDSQGRRTSDARNGLGVTHEFRHSCLIATTIFGKFRIVYEHGPKGELAIIDPAGGVHQLAARESGLISRSLANGARELTCYAASGRCLAKHLISGPELTQIWSRQYSYSSEGDLLSVEDSQQGTFRYEYDAAHRLRREILPEGTARDYTWDAAGNLLQQPGLGSVRLMEGNRVAEANGDAFEFNDRDSVSFRKGRSRTARYEYDSLDRLVRCELDNRTWTAEYDALSRRAKVACGDATTEFYWDDRRLAAEIRQDGSVRIYIFVDHASFVPFMFIEYPNLESDPNEGTRYYVFTDQVGRPVSVENDHRQVVWRAQQDPFGAIDVDPQSSIDLRLRFPGHYHDTETNLHYNHHRYYSPELGRYLQSDPLGVAGGLNLYAYCANPLTSVDLDGLAKHGRGRQTPDPKVDSPAPRAAFATAKEATEAAEKLGFRKTNFKCHGQPVYTDGRRFISPDVDGHNGGVWKMADSVRNLGRKNTRMGTYDGSLSRIGD